MGPKMTYSQAVTKITKLKKLTPIKFNVNINEKWWEVNYKNTVTPIDFLCTSCGYVFQNTINSILYSNTNCKKCSYKNISKTRSQTREEFVTAAVKIHNGLYSYSLITPEWWEENYVGKGKSTSVLLPIICPKHGVFEQTASSHLQKHGCKICSSSLGELFISNFLQERGIKFKSEYTFKDCRSKHGRLFRFDFYLEEFNLIIEYHGKQHYQEVDHFGGEKTLENIKINDKFKENFIFSNGLSFISIPYWHYDDLPQILNTLIYIKDDS